MDLYRYIPVWKRVDDGVMLYRCIEVLGVGFTVQSRDFFAIGTMREMKENLANADVQFIELFLEQAPEVRHKPQKSLEDAIAFFEAEEN